jgi:cardiolipin synthase
VYNLPNLLTISRIVVIPVIFLSIYIHNVAWATFAAILFIIAAITDYFDGYLARSRNETSAFGRLLDPIADKLLVVAALVIVLANGMVHPISYIPVIVILCREVLVSGLREFLAEVKVGMPVTRLAKWKTAFQMTALSCILMGHLNWARVLGEGLLWVAGVLTFITGYEYFQKSLDYVRSTESKKEKTTPAKKSPKK